MERGTELAGAEEESRGLQEVLPLCSAPSDLLHHWPGIFSKFQQQDFWVAEPSLAWEPVVARHRLCSPIRVIQLETCLCSEPFCFFSPAPELYDPVHILHSPLSFIYQAPRQVCYCWVRKAPSCLLTHSNPINGQSRIRHLFSGV